MSASAFTSHPSGTGPMSESTERVGRASKAGWGMEGKAVAPAALAFTGSKSTNHAEAGVQDARRERQAGLALRHQCGTGTGATSQSTEVAGPRAPGGAPGHHERHRPEQTTLYRLVQQHAATFIAETEAAGDRGRSAAERPKAEFDAFLECGILAHGFLRLRCADCGHDRLVAFSCKRRGFCPSCGARRMAQAAAHLVDHVIPMYRFASGCSFGS